MCTSRSFSVQAQVQPPSGSSTTITHVEQHKPQQKVPLLQRRSGQDPEVVDESPSVATPTIKKTKSVSFNSKVRVYLHIHNRDMSSRMIANTWYSHKEYCAIGKEVSACIADAEAQLLQSLQDLQKKSHVTTPVQENELSCCLRGLEYFTLSGSAARLQRRKRAWDVVLKEQDRQWRISNYKSILIETDAIARMYSRASQKCIIQARGLAVQDAMDVLVACGDDKSNPDVGTVLLVA